jgi:hypothetical protein
MEHKPEQYVLPLGIVTRGDVSHLMREAEGLEDAMHQASLRKPEIAPALPEISPLLEEAARLNKIDLRVATERKALVGFLQQLRDKAPLLHMSFSSVASQQFRENLVRWLRDEIHPQVLLQIGLQPAIGAGCMIRTTNKHFDLSLKQRFAKKRDVLVQALHGIGQQPSQPAAALPVQEAKQ